MPIQLIDGKETEVDEQGKPVAPESAPAPAPVEPASPVEPAPAPVEPAPSEGDERTVPLPALHEERHRRQGAERELEEARVRLRDLEQLQIQAQQRDRYTPIDYSRIGTFEEFGAAFQERTDYELVAMKTALSKEVALLRYPDFAEVLAESRVLEEAERNPVLARYLAAQPMPAIAAYQIGLAKVAPTRVASAKAAGEAAGAKKVADQVIKNAEAPVTLANAPSSSAPGPTGLTLDKAAEMSEAEWAALPPETRERLLRGERI